MSAKKEKFVHDQTDALKARMDELPAHLAEKFEERWQIHEQILRALTDRADFDESCGISTDDGALDCLHMWTIVCELFRLERDYMTELEQEATA